ncbi:hypothetical protein D3C87_2118410 [compost metagenome]
MPFTCSGAYERLRPRDWRVDPGTVYVEFGDPIPTEGLDKVEMEPLIERVRGAILSRFRGLEAAK